MELENQRLNQRLNEVEQNTFEQALDFSIGQHGSAQQTYDARTGEGAFKKFVKEYGSMKWQQGQKLTPAQLTSEVVNMLGLSNEPSTPMGTNEQNNEPANKVSPQETKTPESLPNIGTGSNVSMVQKSTNNWDDYMKQLQQS